jgi:capsular exopolysaccharide synthesis family protein
VRDHTIKSTEEAERLYGAPVLGHIPAERFAKGEARRLTIVQHPGSPAAEAYRVLRNSLDFIKSQHDIKALIVMSSAPGEGTSAVAANVAAGLTQAGAKVVLLDCDFRRPMIDQFFEVDNSVGLSDVMLGRSSLKAALQQGGDENLLVLSSGRMPSNPSELLGSAKMSALIETFAEWADWIIVDSPPLLAVADGAAVARWADGVLMVTRGGVSKRDAAKKGREMLDKVGAHVVGVAVWGLEKASLARGYGYGYDSDYSRGYYADYRSHGQRVLDSGARGIAVPAAPADPETSVPVQSSGRSATQSLGRALAGVLAFLAAIAVVATILYFADQYFGWGLVSTLMTILSGAR